MARLKSAVIGWPVSHSLSPKLHGHWIKKYGIDATYERIACKPEDLRNRLETLASDGFAGCNLTIPHKESALGIVDEKDDNARHVGAINTIVIRDGKLVGSSTDGYGFYENLKEHGYAPDASCHALVIGIGGAARAICVRLLDAGATVTIANRTRAKADALVEELGGTIQAVAWDECEAAMSDVNLLVNATPLGMVDQPALEFSLGALPTTATVTDIVYTPLETDLLKSAKKRGNPVVDGLGMLLHQAVPGFEAWFGVRPEVDDTLRRLLLNG